MYLLKSQSHQPPPNYKVLWTCVYPTCPESNASEQFLWGLMFWPILPSLFCSLARWLRCVDKTHPVQKAWGEFYDYLSIKPKLYWMFFVVQLDLSQECLVLRQSSFRIEKNRIVDALIFSCVGVISCLIYIRIVFFCKVRASSPWLTPCSRYFFLCSEST